MRASIGKLRSYWVVAALVLGLAVGWWQPSGRYAVTASIEGRLLDVRHLARGPIAPPPGFAIVAVDDKTLDLEVHAPELGDWVPVHSLSQGTLDLVYLAARLGLVRLVTGDRRPPLVLDDPFVTLDDTRAHRALELLKQVGADFQIIYLTTSDRYDGAADAVVELPGPTAVDVAVDDPALGSPETAAIEGAG